MSINEIMSLVGDDGVNAISNKLGLDKKQANDALLASLPSIVSALNGNTQSKMGLKSLDKAIEKDHDGSLLDNLSGYFQNPDLNDGKGILKHTLGSRRTGVEEKLSAKTGVDANSIGKILEFAAPLVLSYLGKQKKESSSNNGLADILSNLLNSNTNSSNDPADNGFDVGDIANMFINNRKGGIGGFLQGLLGK